MRNLQASLLKSKLWRTAVLAAALAWVPSVLIVGLIHRDAHSTILERDLEEIAEISESTLWWARWYALGIDPDEFEGDEEEEELEEAHTSVDVTTELLAEFLPEGEILEEGFCALLRDANEDVIVGTFRDVLRWHEVEPNVFALKVVADRRLAEEAEENTPWCLVERHELDGGDFLIGHPSRSYETLQRITFLRNVLLALGLPLALVIGTLQSRSTRRFLGALEDTAKRQEKGEVRARVQVLNDGDLLTTADALNQMLDTLEQKMESLSRVGDSIAHDLRTPLARLQGQLDLLKQSSEPSDELVEAIQDQADQLLQTFNALLRIAQIESGARKKAFRSFDVAAVVQDVAELYGPVFAEKEIDFVLQLPRGRVERVGDSDLWLQALSNLVENALKYTPNGGQVELELDDSAGRPRIELRDSGPGIPEGERDNVFRRFYRLQRHRGERGNGLGLALVAAVCELHDAEIYLSGTRGLTVTIQL